MDSLPIFAGVERPPPTRLFLIWHLEKVRIDQRSVAIRDRTWYDVTNAGAKLQLRFVKR